MAGQGARRPMPATSNPLHDGPTYKGVPVEFDPVPEDEQVRRIAES